MDTSMGPERGDAGDARAGDAAEHHVGKDRHIGDAAAQAADEETAEVNDLVHQTGLAHQLAGEHEQRDAEVDEAVHTGEETVGIHHEVAEHLGLDEKVAHGSRADGHDDRRADQQQAKQQDDNNDQCNAHSSISPFFLSWNAQNRFSRYCSIISAAPTGMAR